MTPINLVSRELSIRARRAGGGTGAGEPGSEATGSTLTRPFAPIKHLLPVQVDWGAELDRGGSQRRAVRGQREKGNGAVISTASLRGKIKATKNSGLTLTMHEMQHKQTHTETTEDNQRKTRKMKETERGRGQSLTNSDSFLKALS